MRAKALPRPQPSLPPLAWSRPAAEVQELMALPKRYFDSDLKRLEREGVRVRALGRREGLAPDLVALLEEAERRTAGSFPGSDQSWTTTSGTPTSRAARRR